MERCVVIGSQSKIKRTKLLNSNGITDEDLDPDSLFDELDRSKTGNVTREDLHWYFTQMKNRAPWFLSKASSLSTRSQLGWKQWVLSRKVDKPIHRLLIANNGLAAVKAINSFREWAKITFDDRKVISLVCMATQEDINSNSEFVRMSDELVEIPGGSNINNYANVQVIVNTAIRTNCEAVWAGWGHASENPELPRALKNQGLIWLGPSAEAMENLGDKIRSTLIAQNCNVPVLPWSGDGIDDWKDPESFEQACVQNVTQAIEVIKRIRLPVMIKASEGGGGKGIRRVNKISEVTDAFRQVCSEVPGSPIFIMKLGSNVRHVEVQLIGDAYGHIIALYGRDCSIQRRHQKIIEEGPVIKCLEKTIKEMMDSAVALAEEIKYEGAGTVEYLLFQDGSYCFLELNPRLQVEHGVTELICNVNLPACQLLVAMGFPLYNIPEIREFYGKDPKKIGEFDLKKIKPKSINNHVIACRITAEDPSQGFRPTTGKIDELILRPRVSVYGYFSMKPGSSVHEFADSQFGHIFSMGITREKARINMLNTLRNLDIRGEINTNVEFLQFVLETKDYKEINVTTEWLETLEWKKTVNVETIVVLGAVVTAHKDFCDEQVKAISDVTRGRGMMRKKMAGLAEVDLNLIFQDINYSFWAHKESVSRYILGLNNRSWETGVEVQLLADGGFLVSLNCHTYVVYRSLTSNGLQIRVDGKEHNFEKAYDPSKLKAGSSGKLVKLLVQSGTHIEKGQSYAEIEVMKMILTLEALESGIVDFKIAEGSLLQADTVIGTLKLDQPEKTKKTLDFKKSFLNMGDPHNSSPMLKTRLADSVARLKQMMAGYAFTTNSLYIRKYLRSMVDCLREPEMPIHDFYEALSSIHDRIPKSMHQKLEVLVDDYLLNATASLFPWETPILFPVEAMREVILSYLENETESYETKQLEQSIKPLIVMLKTWEEGAGMYATKIFGTLLKNFHEVEAYFSGYSPEETMAKLTQQFKGDSEKIVDILFAHSRLEYRIPIVLELLDIIDEIFDKKLVKYQIKLKPVIENLMQMTASHYGKVHIKCRQILKPKVDSKYDRWANLDRNLRSGRSSTIAYSDIFGMIPKFLNENDENDTLLKNNALLLFIERLFTNYKVTECVNHEDQKKITSILGLFTFNLTPLNISHSLSGVSSILKSGIILFFNNFLAGMNQFGSHVKKLGSPKGKKYMIVVIFVESLKKLSEDEANEKIQKAIIKYKNELIKFNIEEVMFLLFHSQDETHQFFVYPKESYYNEAKLKRNIPPPVAALFEIDRFRGFDDEVERIKVPESDVVVYGWKKKQKLFARCCVTPNREERVRLSSIITEQDIEKAISHYELALFEVLLALEQIQTNDPETFCNAEIMLVYEYDVDSELPKGVPIDKFMNMNKIVQSSVRKMSLKDYYNAVNQCNVNSIEFIMRSRSEYFSLPIARLFVQIPYCRCIKMWTYIQFQKSGKKMFVSLNQESPGPYDNLILSEGCSGPSHAQFEAITTKKSRQALKTIQTVYAYDWPMLFEIALTSVWKDLVDSGNKKFVISTELILNEDKTGIIEIERDQGKNDIGMIAWKMQLFTPEYPEPEGRDIILVSNDITKNIGTFAIKENALYSFACQFAIKKKIPFIYMSCNSGARMGLAKEVMDVFCVSWEKDENPDLPKGVEYLYLTQQNYMELKDYVVCDALNVGNETRYVLRAILGKEHGLSVENLSASGLIAGNTARAYQETFTLSYVTGRSVGIGAYLNRLSQRIIQKSGSPILLTGFQALNSLLGKKVYLSNLQLGGFGIMLPNGVSHLAVHDDLGGVEHIIKWLSYVPKTLREISFPSTLNTINSDPINRQVTFEIKEGMQFDPRLMIAGGKVKNNIYVEGLFDNDSFTETLSGWAKGIVVGRARLGGIPIGVIVVDTRSTTKIVPADPADKESVEQITEKAGKVWYSDSAFKTAQSIKDFNHENLSLFILANWRGFSGGASDMFDEVLKFGANIVDALLEYKQPIFVYIPPYSEVRGGAWVVIDSQINAEFIEMYASENARGGVLEPNAIVEFKYRKEMMNKTMRRLDPVLQQLIEGKQLPNVMIQIQRRQHLLHGIYKQIAIKFADLHDCPERLLAKNTIREIIPWKKSRNYFYWRLRYRLHLQKIYMQIKDISINHLSEKILNLVKQKMKNVEISNYLIATWCDNNPKPLINLINQIRQETILTKVIGLLKDFPDGFRNGIKFLKDRLELD